MRDTAIALALAAALLLSLLLGGCSGPGVTAQQVAGGAVQTTAENHLSAVTLLKGWFAILYPGVSAPEGGASCEREWEFEILPDGSRHEWGTNSDCSTFDNITQRDGSGVGTRTRLNGDISTITWSSPIDDGSTVTRDIVWTFWDGARLEFVSVIHYIPPNLHHVWEGTITLPDGRTLAFVLDRWQVKEDHLVLTPPDGSRLEVRVPLMIAHETVYWPVLETGASGSFTSPAGEALDFDVTGHTDRWDRWDFDSADGTTGVFAIDNDFGGRIGQLKKGGKAVGALRWLPTMFGTLYLFTAGRVDVTPSAAARDFQIDRWISSIAAIGPSPQY